MFSRDKQGSYGVSPAGPTPQVGKNLTLLFTVAFSLPGVHSALFPTLTLFPLSFLPLYLPLSFPLTQHPVVTFGLACSNMIFSERSLVPPVGTLVLSCSGGLRLPLLPLPPFSSNAPYVVAITAYVCKLCVFLNRVWNDGAGMCQTEQYLTSNIMNCKTCTKVLIYCVLCVYKASGLVKGIFWVVCNLMSVESIFEVFYFWFCLTNL